MKNKKRCFLAILLVLLLVFSLISCDDGTLRGDYGSSMPDVDNSYDGGYGNEGAPGESSGTGEVLTEERKIITTVNARMETEHYDTLITELKAAVAAAGGYFVNFNYSGNGLEEEGSRAANFQIRIPAERLSEFTGKMGKLGTVLSYRENANDVTLAYTDIESRIAVLEAEEAALRNILAQAQTTKDILAIRSSLTATQSELDSLRAQKRTYDTLVAYSTVYLNVNEVKRARVEEQSFFDEVGNDFMDTLTGVGAFFRALLVFVIGVSPVLLIPAAFALLAVVIIRLVRASSRRKAKKQKSGTSANNNDN